MKDLLNELAMLRAKGALKDPTSGMRLPDETLARHLDAFSSEVFDGKKARFTFENRPQQELAIRRALEDEDVTVCLPTGSGKSFVYQFPAWLRKRRVTLVISPLRALIADQTEGARGVVGLTSETADSESVWRDLESGSAFALLVAPERLQSEEFRARLLSVAAKRGLDRFVIDEAHCVSDWGHGFRPQYWWVASYLEEIERQYLAARTAAKRIPRLLLTATMDDKVATHLRQHFGPSAVKRIVRGDLERHELVLLAKQVRDTGERERELKDFLARQATRDLPPGVKRRGIIYTLEAVDPSVSADDPLPHWKANQIAEKVASWGYRAVTFSSKGMTAAGRAEARRAFADAGTESGTLTVVVATSAFGMGMDYDRVPFVCHAYPRPNLPEYWQQVGRAGRQMRVPAVWAECMSLWSEDDEAYAHRFGAQPALDGSINAFTVPAHGHLLFWPPNTEGRFQMMLRGPSGKRTKCGMLLAELQAAGLVAPSPVGRPSLQGVEEYEVTLPALRTSRGRALVTKLQKGRFGVNPGTKKVLRYLRIAADGVDGRVVLDQRSFLGDKAMTALQRLNRWVDVGALTRVPGAGPGRMVFDVTSKALDKNLVRLVEQREMEWWNFNRRELTRMFDLLREVDPARRRKLVVEHFFGKDAAAADRPFVPDLPASLLATGSTRISSRAPVPPIPEKLRKPPQSGSRPRTGRGRPSVVSEAPNTAQLSALEKGIAQLTERVGYLAGRVSAVLGIKVEEAAAAPASSARPRRAPRKKR